MKDRFGNNHECDIVIVGAGLYGAVCARELTNAGFKCLVIDKRLHIAGNCFIETDKASGINVHKYGAHIFHTDDVMIYNYVCKYADEVIPFVNSPIANYKGELYNLPFNMNTFAQIFKGKGITPLEMKDNIEYEIDEARKSGINVDNPTNLEEKAISMVGTTIYKKLVKEYTEKQWGRDCKELDPSIINRLPLRFIFDNNYFNDKYQLITNYTKLVQNLLFDIPVMLNTSFNDIEIENELVLYTGSLDELFDYKYGKLEYRGLRFENKVFNEYDHQGVAVMNYTSHDVPYTRSIEHKLFDNSGEGESTIISYEYSLEASDNVDPYYPINNHRNSEIHKKYLKEIILSPINIYIGGRLAEYKYYDMDDTILSALELSDKIIKEKR